MPHWNDKGEQEWVCQVGAHICTGSSIWIDGKGNVCPKCLPSIRTAEEVAAQAWERYCKKRDKLIRTGAETVGTVQRFYDEYQKELDDAGIIATLAGYIFKEST